MFSAKELQRACPRYQTWLQLVFESGVAVAKKDGVRSFSSTTTSRRPKACHGRQPSQLRPLSTSHGAAGQQVQSESSAEPEDTEAVVRQAKATFGDTLPKDYLTSRELKLYERLYGPPLRETRPEDVGITPESQERESRHALLIETDDGVLEQVNYSVQVRQPHEDTGTGDAGQPLEGAENAQTLESMEVEYINTPVRSSREYHALAKLQRDFEVASLEAAKEEQKRRERTNEEEEDEDEEWEDMEEEEEYDENDERGVVRTPEGGAMGRLHPLTIQNWSRTTPSTVQLPRSRLVEPITELLRRTDTSHIQLAAEKAFGGRGLPHSPATPQGRPNLGQLPIPIEAGHHRMSEIEADAFLATVMPGVYATAMSTLVEVRRRLGSGWIQNLLTKPDGSNVRVLDVGGGGAALAAWNEVLRSETLALRERGVAPFETLAAHMEQREQREQLGQSEKDTEEGGQGKGRSTEKAVLVGSDALRHRISRFLYNTTFLPRLPDVAHAEANAQRHLDAPASAPARKKYDVIISSHMLMPLTRTHERRSLVANLWAQLNPEGGVLIILEKGHPRGFEAVADARQRILTDFMIGPGQEAKVVEEIVADGIDGDGTAKRRPREPGMIIAPCTSHGKCPLYLTPGQATGRKDFCHFSQRFIRPPFLQKIYGMSHRNHEDINFSYIAVQRGTQPTTTTTTPSNMNDAAVLLPLQTGAEATDAAFAGYESISREALATGLEPVPHPLSLPRMVLAPLKRRGHVTMDVCTPAGQLERWTVPRSRSLQAYHDARKSQWGDLWALGAKTRTPRTPRTGRVDGRAGKKAEKAAKAARKAARETATIGGGIFDGIEGTGSGSRKKSGKQSKSDAWRPELADMDLPDFRMPATPAVPAASSMPKRPMQLPHKSSMRKSRRQLEREIMAEIGIE